MESVLPRTLYMARKHFGRYWRIGTNKVRRLGDRIQCYRYFITRRSLPSRLIWNHLQPIYARARKHYEISAYSGDTMIAHESTNSVEEWCEMLEGVCAVVPGVPVKHLDLLSAEYADLWVEEFLTPLAVGGWNHEEIEQKENEKSSVAEEPDGGRFSRDQLRGARSSAVGGTGRRSGGT